MLQAITMMLAMVAPGTCDLPEGKELTQYESEMLTHLNKHRERHGLHPVVIDWDVQKSARSWANTMASNGSMVHSSFGWENIAMGQRDPQQVTRTWINSGDHNANMLRRSHTRVGLSGYRSRSGSVYWVQQFR